MKLAPFLFVVAAAAAPSLALADYRPVPMGRYSTHPGHEYAGSPSDCQAKCAIMSGGVCTGLTAAICGIASVISFGGALIPCAVLGGIACTGAAGAGVYCSNQCRR